MSTVDYSRFDKIGLSDDEDEDEEMGPPGVYRVGEGQFVTISGVPLEEHRTMTQAISHNSPSAWRLLAGLLRRSLELGGGG